MYVYICIYILFYRTVLKKLKICAICVKNVELCAKLCANITKKEPFTSILCTLFIKKEKTKRERK